MVLGLENTNTNHNTYLIQSGYTRVDMLVEDIIVWHLYHADELT